MPRRSGRGASIFSALPWDLKSTLRSNPVAEPSTSDSPEAPSTGLLPTQPPSDAGEEGGDAYRNIDEEEVIAAVNPSSEEPSGSQQDEPASASRKRSSDSPAKPSPSKRAKVEEERHPWDCTGLVPRYEKAADVPQHLKKYFFQRHSLFPAYSRLPLLLDDTGWFSVTPSSIAEHIAERCRSDVVLDAFCGVGGNAIAFARTCERVIAMDNDITRLKLARHNALHYGVADRIEFVLADYVEWAREYVRRGAHQREEIDVVFLSPPWGGPEYLSFGAEGSPTYPLSAVLPVPGDELFALTAPVTPNIAYYLPRNVDIAEVAALANKLDRPENDAEGGAERSREWVEVEEEWVGDKLKAVTAYYGGLVDG
ncbi:hypothetical protein CC85DRAFT_285912 [Cutaneotrichosporon oleaginosum]|uniref:Trimethylguanosine synthase n=1 Tax=Cutaneotrichosporon oleaginosum TaxID=879819 RepID=A0A0J0XLL3_9TREE|nr:uncharacterized protein CC85DRAFT_285912 [Cutaneotrichosporon oleaginosum]KLT41980.1 hypothetical protein CC85DRAFT_285912 [Cutaneotrichosporon oleaginosum]TXT14361.1 hypothetical protein COLE_00554 [Cutaneotrichosporon oleaginosum]